MAKKKQPSTISIKKAIAKKEYEMELLRIDLNHTREHDDGDRYNTHAIGFQLFPEYDEYED